MSNKNVRLSANERVMHDKAVALRKKTDAQLMAELQKCWDEGCAEGRKHAEEEAYDAGKRAGFLLGKAAAAGVTSAEVTAAIIAYGD